MAVYRSVLFAAGNNNEELEECLKQYPDAIVLDLEDLVPPQEKERARTMVRENLKHAAVYGSDVWVRVNAYDTGMTDHDLESVVYEGISCINLTKVNGAADVKALAKKLDELEAERGLESGSVKICLLLETANGVIHAYEALTASPRIIAAIFGAVDYTRDMGVKITPEAKEQAYARGHIAVACRAAGVTGLDAPFLSYQDKEAYERNIEEGKQIGFKGRMIVHPSLVEAANRLYAPNQDEIDWAKGCKEAFEAEGLAKGKAAVIFQNRVVDTPVYTNACNILKMEKEIQEKTEAKKKARENL